MKNKRSLIKLMVMLFAITGMVFLNSATAKAATPGKINNIYWVESSTNSVSFGYAKASNAYAYEIYLYDGYGNYLKKYYTTVTTKTITGLTPQTPYIIKVRGYVTSGGKTVYGSYSSRLFTATNPENISNIKYTPTSQTTVDVSWKKLSNVTGYHIYRYNEETTKWVFVTTVTKPGFTATDLPKGKNTQYIVKAYYKYRSITHYSDKVKLNVCATPVDVSNVSVTEQNFSSLKFEWERAEGATGYEVTLYDPAGNEVKVVRTASTCAKFFGLEFLKGYTVSVKAYRYCGDNRRIYSNATKLKAYTKIGKLATINQVYTQNETTTIKFDKVEGATQYRIYEVNEDGSKTQIGITTSSVFSIEQPGENDEIKLCVMPIRVDGDKKYFGTISDEYTALRLPVLIKEFTVSNYKEDGFNVNWKALKNVTGYKVYYRNPETGKYTYYKKVTNTNVTFTSLKAGTEYEFCMVAEIGQDDAIIDVGKSTSKATTAPVAVKLSGSYSGENTYRVSWTDSKNQTGYDLWKYADSSKSWVKVGTTENNYYDYSVENDKDTLRFKVRPYIKTDRGYVCGVFSDVVLISMGRIGIDVSSHQGVIDWSKVKKDGIDFVIIRIGYRGYEKGTLKEDSQFKNNITGALANGIDVGIYFFSTSISVAEAREEARWVLNRIKGYNVTYPIVYDYEGFDDPDYRSYNQSKTARTNYAIAFLDVVRENGYIPMMYASQGGYKYNWDTKRLADRYILWCAKYPNSSGNFLPQYEPKIGYPYVIWQYTSSGKVSGINTKVDMNYQYTSLTK